MKYFKPVLLSIILISALDASPRGHHRHRSFRGHPGWAVGFTGAYYTGGVRYYDPFWGPTYLPGNQFYFSGEYELADAELILAHIETLSALKKRGILTDKEFKRAKGRLLNRLGKYVPAEKNVERTSEILKQMEQLYNSQTMGVLDGAEFAQQKKKLLRLL